MYVYFAQNVYGLFDWQLLPAMAFFNAGTGGSVYVVRIRHMYLLCVEDQGINIKHTVNSMHSIYNKLQKRDSHFVIRMTLKHPFDLKLQLTANKW